MLKWLIDDLNSALAELKRTSTWLVLGLITAFGLLAFGVAQFAFQTDSVLRFLRISVTACRELTNGPIIFLFCGMIFFLFAVVITFGEIQRYFYFRDRRSYHQSQRAARHALGWGSVATSIAAAALVFFKSNC